MRTARAIFDDFQGEWAFNRQVMPGGTMTGKALFTRHSADHLHYAETGILTTDDGAVLEPSRAYDYYWREGRIFVYYADGPQKGAAFLELPFIDSRSTADHHCGKDVYKAQYHFIHEREFSTEFSVSGPRKHYVHRTDFSKISG